MKTKSNILSHEWIISGTTKDEGFKIVTKDAYIGNEDDGFQRELIAIVYSQEMADYIISLHDCERNTP